MRRCQLPPPSLLLSFPEEIGFPLLAVNQPGDIAPVHEDDEHTGRERPSQDPGIVMVKNEKSNAKGCRCQYGAQGYVSGEAVGNGKHRQYDQSNAPVQEQGNQKAAENSLAAFETQNQMSLFNILIFNSSTANINLLIFNKVFMLRLIVHTLFNHFNKVIMTNFSHGYGNHIIGGIVRMHISEHTFFSKSSNVFCAA